MTGVQTCALPISLTLTLTLTLTLIPTLTLDLKGHWTRKQAERLGDSKA